MTDTRNKLYLLLAVACTAGYVWLFYNMHTGSGINGSDVDVCIFKHVTNIPCPSCGSTRSVLSLVKGDIADSFFLNPIGIFLFLILIIAPVWIAYDILSKKESLFKFYNRLEKILQQKQVAIPAVALIIVNWIWNIYKGL